MCVEGVKDEYNCAASNEDGCVYIYTVCIKVKGERVLIGKVKERKDGNRRHERERVNRFRAAQGRIVFRPVPLYSVIADTFPLQLYPCVSYQTCEPRLICACMPAEISGPPIQAPSPIVSLPI